MTYGVEFVREECKKRGISVAQLEKDLGFSNGYLNPKKLHEIPYKRAKMISVYLGIDFNRVVGETDAVEESQQQKYYYDDETAEILEAMATNPKLKALFYAQRNMSEDEVNASTAFYDAMTVMKRKEERLDNDPC